MISFQAAIEALFIRWMENDYRDPMACNRLGMCRQTKTGPAKYGSGKLLPGRPQGQRKQTDHGVCQPPDPDENRWKVLSNHQKICDFGETRRHGSLTTSRAISTAPYRTIEMDSPSMTTAPFPRLTAGMGWRPDDRREIAGRSLILRRRMAIWKRRWGVPPLVCPVGVWTFWRRFSGLRARFSSNFSGENQ